MRKLSILAALFLLAACHPAPEAGIPKRQITVSGEGEISVSPDRAIVMLGVEFRDKGLDRAREQAESTLRKLLEMTDKLGIAREQMNSTQIFARPEYRYDDGEQVFIGYFVNRGLRVELHDISQLGALMDGAFEAGATNISPPQLTVSNPREQYRKAIEAAAADARLNAERLAASFDTRAGRVIRLSAGGDAPVEPMMRAQEMTFLAGKGTQMEIGEISFHASVQASFELND